ncbi:hypothetical protein [Roseovarius mucosus]|uniref:hypothetical protein n=1 Tax=Roseovarius mucosus TaxID=215743 RepID=UPI0035CFB419|tara:strand:+ start:524 stop:2677 length:2154 start_codon:yes stop_codon:yes gene_type:complete
MRGNIWADPTSFFSTPSDAAAVLRDLELPRIDQYLAALSDNSDIKLENLNRLSVNTLVAMTGDDHLKTRRVIAPFFSKDGLKHWADILDAGVSHALAQLSAAPKPDLVANFTIPLFLRVMPQMFGLKIDESEAHFRAIETVQRLTEPYLSVPTLRKLEHAVGLLIRTFPDPSAHQSPDQPETLIEYLYRRRSDLPAGLDARYLVLGILVGSNSATQSVAFALYGLLTGPPRNWQDAARPGWAERELPRLLSLYQSTRTLVRVAPEATTIAGCPFHKGQAAVVDIVKTNSCLRSDTKSGVRHMSFGSGAHKCPGSFLSEMVFAQSIPALARRFPSIVLNKEQCSFVQTPMMQAPTALPCETAQGSHRATSRLCDIRDTALAHEVVRDNDRFSPPQMTNYLSTLAQHSGRDLTIAVKISQNALFFMDGPRHEALRTAIGRRLGATRLQDWTDLADTAIADALDNLTRMPNPDLVTGFTDLLRQTVIAPILGVFPSDPSQFERLAPELQAVLEPWLSMRDLLAVQEKFNEAMALMTVPTTANCSLLSDLLAEPPEGFSTDDLKAVVLVLYGASFNLSHTLANILHLILSDPVEERANIETPDWISTRLEELIALCASPKYIYRMARADLELAGMAMKAGDTARLTLQAINRDRNPGALHLSFGQGMHRCVGAALSRLIIRRAIPAVFERFPNLSLVNQGQRYFPMSQTVALSALPCVLSS